MVRIVSEVCIQGSVGVRGHGLCAWPTELSAQWDADADTVRVTTWAVFARQRCLTIVDSITS